MLTQYKVLHTIDKDRYLWLLDQLTAIAKKCKTSIEYRRRSPLKDEEFLPNNSEGLHYSEENRIIIILFGLPTDIDVLFTLAHEVRHCMHLRYHMFTKCYTYYEDYITHEALRANILAEHECNTFAFNWLLGRGVNSSISHRVYKTEDTSAARELLLDKKNNKKASVWFKRLDTWCEKHHIGRIKEELNERRQCDIPSAVQSSEGTTATA